MKLQRVEIENLGGLECIAFDTVGSLVEVTGQNGSGKTSLLNSLRAVVEGGHDPSLIRLGAKKGVVRLLLDDNTTIVRTITEKASRTEITTSDGQIVPAPQSFIAELCGSFSFDPTSLISATPKERTAYLLSAMPIKFMPDEIAATGAERPDQACAPPVDLDGLAAIRDGVFGTRKTLNKSVRDSEGTIASLRQGMPAEDGADWAAKWKELEAEATDVEVQIRDAEKQAVNEYLAAANELRQARDGAIADLQKQIAELEKAIKVAGQLCESRIAEVRNEQDSKLKVIAERAKPARDTLATEKAQAWERSQAQGKALGARQTIEAMAVKVRADSVEAERLTRVLDALDALRRRKLDELPIPGVELKDGEVYVGGVPFEQLNTAQQFALSIRLAKLKLGRLPLIILDHCEAFSSETWELFRESAKESGLQIVTARVSDTPLTVVAS
jgi:energy-coupling factor transporter ATP-binding protein EcfA2